LLKRKDTKAGESRVCIARCLAMTQEAKRYQGW